MKVVKESLYSETNEGLKDAFKKLSSETRSRIARDTAERILSDNSKLQKIIDVLKNHPNPHHLENFIKAKKEFDAGNKDPLNYFLCFISDNWSAFKNGEIIYYRGDKDGIKAAGDIDWPL